MKCNFAKYKGQEWAQIAQQDPGYLDWVKRTIKAEGKFASQNQAILDEIDRIQGQVLRPPMRSTGGTGDWSQPSKPTGLEAAFPNQNEMFLQIISEMIKMRIAMEKLTAAIIGHPDLQR